MKPTHLFLKLVMAVAITLNLAAHSALAVIGYVNVPVSANRYYLFENPLSATNNTLNSVIAGGGVPDGIRVWTWDVTNQVFLGPSEYDAGLQTWTINFPVPVGKGFMLHAPASGNITFVGEVLQGALTNAVAGTNKLSLLGSMVPQAGGVSSLLQFPPSDGDTVYQFSTGAQQYLDARSYFSGYGWFTNEPSIAVAEGFFVQHPGPDKNWVRNFTVNLAGLATPTTAKPTPEIESCSIRDGTVTLKINKATKRYNVQFSTDRVTWTNMAVNQTIHTWKGPLPPDPVGFFQVVQP